MKKVLSSALCLGLMAGNIAAFAEETPEASSVNAGSQFEQLGNLKDAMKSAEATAVPVAASAKAPVLKAAAVTEAKKTEVASPVTFESCGLVLESAAIGTGLVAMAGQTAAFGALLVPNIVGATFNGGNFPFIFPMIGDTYLKYARTVCSSY